MKMTFKNRKLFVLSYKHLLKSTQVAIDYNINNVYAVTFENINGIYRDIYNKRAAEGYSIIFTHKGKGKILIYNN